MSAYAPKAARPVTQHFGCCGTPLCVKVFDGGPYNEDMLWAMVASFQKLRFLRTRLGLVQIESFGVKAEKASIKSRPDQLMSSWPMHARPTCSQYFRKAAAFISSSRHVPL
jgi:hypothetical protein